MKKIRLLKWIFVCFVVTTTWLALNLSFSETSNQVRAQYTDNVKIRELQKLSNNVKLRNHLINSSEFVRSDDLSHDLLHHTNINGVIIEPKRFFDRLSTDYSSENSKYISFNGIKRLFMNKTSESNISELFKQPSSLNKLKKTGLAALETLETGRLEPLKESKASSTKLLKRSESLKMSNINRPFGKGSNSKASELNRLVLSKISRKTLLKHQRKRSVSKLSKLSERARSEHLKDRLTLKKITPHLRRPAKVKTPSKKSNTARKSNIIVKKNLQYSDEPSEKYSLCYSLFGKNAWMNYRSLIFERIENLKKSKFYSKWTVRIFHDGLPADVQNNVTSLHSKIKFHNVNDVKKIKFDLINRTIHNIININARTWRFLPLGDPDVDVTCSRDLDSPLLKREEDAVKHWLRSGKLAHLMRDNPAHFTKIMGGLWCFKNSKSLVTGQAVLFALLSHASRRSKHSEGGKFNDQVVLFKYMWPLIKDDVIQHDSYHCELHRRSEPFPSERKDNCFVGGFHENNCDKMKPCPRRCRPKSHQSWKYC